MRRVVTAAVFASGVLMAGLASPAGASTVATTPDTGEVTATSAPATSDTTAGSVTAGSVTAGSAVPFVQPAYCLEILDFEAAGRASDELMSADVKDPAAINAEIDKLLPWFDKLKADAPDEIKADAQTSFDGTLKLVDALRKANWDTKQISAADKAELNALAPAVSASNDKLRTYRENACHIHELKFCARVKEYRDVAAALTAGMNATPVDAETMTSTVARAGSLQQGLLDNAGADTKADVQLLFDAQNTVYGILQKVGFDTSKIVDGSADATTITNAANNPELEAASKRLDAWAQTNCGLAPQP